MFRMQSICSSYGHQRVLWETRTFENSEHVFKVPRFNYPSLKIFARMFNIWGNLEWRENYFMSMLPTGQLMEWY